MVDPQKALNYQSALAMFTRIVNEPDSVQRLLQNCVAQVARITHIRHVKILRYRPDKGDLLIEAGVGWKPGVVGHVSFGADRHSAPGRSIQTGAPVIAEDIANDPEFRYADVLREHGIVSVLNVPIMVDGTHWGVLEVDTVEKAGYGTDAARVAWPAVGGKPLAPARRTARRRQRAEGNHDDPEFPSSV